MKTLVLGGVRSGKSRYAETLARQAARPVTYIATATAQDDEMRRRIEAHRARRPVEWTVVEEPLALADALRRHASGRFVIVDCLTLWLTNLLLAEDGRFEHERVALLAALPSLASDVVFVSNETGMGIVPLGELSRRFSDEAGQLHQDLAQCCERVVLMVAGLPLTLKGAA
ncbi:MAG: bifunctional adenosylcobinamide kinase/adenosylcobinamide-phosphate guanylyltransferase [Sulfurifustaceae bacterium]